MNKLIVCCTPYQIFLVNMLIDKYQLKNIHLFYLGKVDEKAHLYFEKAIDKVDKFDYFEIGKVNRLVEILSFKRFCKKRLERRYKELWFANFSALEVKIINGLCEFQDYIGFDDGLGSININSGIYRESSSILRFILYYFLGVRLVDYYLFRLIRNYYGVYKDELYPFKEIYNIGYKPNIVDNSRGSKVLKIFVAQPFNQDVLNYIELEKFLNENKVVYFFPHHRQNFVLSSLEIIETNYIFEDYIKDIICLNKYKEIIIYSINSSVLLNCSKFEGVKCISLRNKYLYSKYKYLYDLMEDSGIEVVDYEFY